MSELVKLLLMPILIAAGGWAGLQFPAISTRGARIAVWTLLFLLFMLFLTGLTLRGAASHRSLAHFFLGTAWVLILLAMGVGFAEGIRSRRWSTAFPVLALLLALAALQAAANTGYLGRLSDRPADVLRFRLVHQLLTPGATGVFLACWLRWSRSVATDAERHLIGTKERST